MRVLTKKQIAISLLFILFTSPVYATDWYEVDVDQSVDIDEHEVCKKVTNNCSNGIFVPTKTSPEWEAFRNNKPACVTLADCFVCGSNLVINHSAGDVAPVTKSVTYGTVTSSLSGASKCWITQNLGATNQASSATDATEASAGWYWQFNRKQGYQYISSRIPTAWDTSCDVTEDDWDSAKDPCALLLGAGWRLPTGTEWTNADATGGWDNIPDAYNSDLKLHAAGSLFSDGVVFNRGIFGYYWSRTYHSDIYGYYLSLRPLPSFTQVDKFGGKVKGYNVRCLKD